jgi:hypothetical protein
MEQLIKLPYKLAISLTASVVALVGRAAMEYGIAPTPENVYEIGKQVISIGLSLCAASKHTSQENLMQDIGKIQETIGKSIESLETDLESLAANRPIDKNSN